MTIHSVADLSASLMNLNSRLTVFDEYVKVQDTPFSHTHLRRLKIPTITSANIVNASMSPCIRHTSSTGTILANVLDCCDEAKAAIEDTVKHRLKHDQNVGSVRFTEISR